jgi:hypothetical protein
MTVVPLSSTNTAPLTAVDVRAFATSQLDRLMGFYPRVDGKASFLLTLNVTMVGLLALNFPVNDFGSSRGVIGFIAFFFLGLALWRLGFVFFPHVEPGEKLSLVFFGDVAKQRWPDYHRALLRTSEADLLEDLTCQIWRNSKILKVKFDETKLALISMIFALPFWLMLLFATALRAGKFTLGT